MVHLPAHLGRGAAMRILCERVEGFLPELFTFLVELWAGADNNPAERGLRPPVLSRKTGGGTCSGEGMEIRSIMAFLFDAWGLPGRNPYHALDSILSQSISTPV